MPLPLVRFPGTLFALHDASRFALCDTPPTGLQWRLFPADRLPLRRRRRRPRLPLLLKTRRAQVTERLGPLPPGLQCRAIRMRARLREKRPLAVGVLQRVLGTGTQECRGGCPADIRCQPSL